MVGVFVVHDADYFNFGVFGDGEWARFVGDFVFVGLDGDVVVNYHGLVTGLIDGLVTDLAAGRIVNDGLVDGRLFDAVPVEVVGVFLLLVGRHAVPFVGGVGAVELAVPLKHAAGAYFLASFGECFGEGHVVGDAGCHCYLAVVNAGALELFGGSLFHGSDFVFNGVTFFVHNHGLVAGAHAHHSCANTAEN